MFESYEESRNRAICETGDYEIRMVEFSDALELAKAAWDESIYGGPIDHCCEMEDAYLFSKSDYYSCGGAGPILIWKLGGGYDNYVVYSLDGPHKIVHEGPLSDFSD